MAKVVPLKEAAEPASERARLSKAISDAKRKRDVLLTHREHMSRAEQLVAQTAAKVEAATAGVETAKALDADDIVKNLRGGTKVVGMAAVRAARQAEADARDEYDGAVIAHKRLGDDLRIIAEGAALAANEIHVRRGELISGLIKELVAEGERVKQREYVITCLLSSLTAAAGEVPVLEQMSEPIRIKCAADRDAVVAEAKELVKRFMLANVTDADRAVGEAACQKLGLSLNWLLEDPAAELSAKESV
jgi:hypothetical protein